MSGSGDLEKYYDRSKIPKHDPDKFKGKVLRPATFRAFLNDYQVSVAEAAQRAAVDPAMLQQWLTGSMRKNPQVRKFLVPRLIAFKYEEREFRKRALQAKRELGQADETELQQHPQMAHVPMHSLTHRPNHIDGIQSGLATSGGLSSSGGGARMQQAALGAGLGSALLAAAAGGGLGGNPWASITAGMGGLAPWSGSVTPNLLGGRTTHPGGVQVGPPGFMQSMLPHSQGAMPPTSAYMQATTAGMQPRPDVPDSSRTSGWAASSPASSHAPSAVPLESQVVAPGFPMVRAGDGSRPAVSSAGSTHAAYVAPGSSAGAGAGAAGASGAASGGAGMSGAEGPPALLHDYTTMLLWRALHAADGAGGSGNASHGGAAQGRRGPIKRRRLERRGARGASRDHGDDEDSIDVPHHHHIHDPIGGEVLIATSSQAAWWDRRAHAAVTALTRSARMAAAAVSQVSGGSPPLVPGAPAGASATSGAAAPMIGSDIPAGTAQPALPPSSSSSSSSSPSQPLAQHAAAEGERTLPSTLLHGFEALARAVFRLHGGAGTHGSSTARKAPPKPATSDDRFAAAGYAASARRVSHHLRHCLHQAAEAAIEACRVERRAVAQLHEGGAFRDNGERAVAQSSRDGRRSVADSNGPSTKTAFDLAEKQAAAACVAALDSACAAACVCIMEASGVLQACRQYENKGSGRSIRLPPPEANALVRESLSVVEEVVLCCARLARSKNMRRTAIGAGESGTSASEGKSADARGAKTKNNETGPEQGSGEQYRTGPDSALDTTSSSARGKKEARASGGSSSSSSAALYWWQDHDGGAVGLEELAMDAPWLPTVTDLMQHDARSKWGTDSGGSGVEGKGTGSGGSGVSGVEGKTASGAGLMSPGGSSVGLHRQRNRGMVAAGSRRSSQPDLKALQVKADVDREAAGSPGGASRDGGSSHDNDKPPGGIRMSVSEVSLTRSEGPGASESGLGDGRAPGDGAHDHAHAHARDQAQGPAAGPSPDKQVGMDIDGGDAGFDGGAEGHFQSIVPRDMGLGLADGSSFGPGHARRRPPSPTFSQVSQLSGRSSSRLFQFEWLPFQTESQGGGSSVSAGRSTAEASSSSTGPRVPAQVTQLFGAEDQPALMQAQAQAVGGGQSADLAVNANAVAQRGGVGQDDESWDGLSLPSQAAPTAAAAGASAASAAGAADGAGAGAGAGATPLESPNASAPAPLHESVAWRLVAVASVAWRAMRQAAVAAQTRASQTVCLRAAVDAAVMVRSLLQALPVPLLLPVPREAAMQLVHPSEEGKLMESGGEEGSAKIGDKRARDQAAGDGSSSSDSASINSTGAGLRQRLSLSELRQLWGHHHVIVHPQVVATEWVHSRPLLRCAEGLMGHRAGWEVQEAAGRLAPLGSREHFHPRQYRISGPRKGSSGNKGGGGSGGGRGTRARDMFRNAAVGHFAPGELPPGVPGAAFVLASRPRGEDGHQQGQGQGEGQGQGSGGMKRSRSGSDLAEQMGLSKEASRLDALVSIASIEEPAGGQRGKGGAGSGAGSSSGSRPSSRPDSSGGSRSRSISGSDSSDMRLGDLGASKLGGGTPRSGDYQGLQRTAAHNGGHVGGAVASGGLVVGTGGGIGVAGAGTGLGPYETAPISAAAGAAAGAGAGAVAGAGAGAHNQLAALLQAVGAGAGGAAGGLSPAALAALVDVQHQAAQLYHMDALPLGGGQRPRSGSYVRQGAAGGAAGAGVLGALGMGAGAGLGLNGMALLYLQQLQHLQQLQRMKEAQMHAAIYSQAQAHALSMQRGAPYGAGHGGAGTSTSGGGAATSASGAVYPPAIGSGGFAPLASSSSSSSSGGFGMGALAAASMAGSGSASGGPPASTSTATASGWPGASQAASGLGASSSLGMPASGGVPASGPAGVPGSFQLPAYNQHQQQQQQQQQQQLAQLYQLLSQNPGLLALRGHFFDEATNATMQAGMQRRVPPSGSASFSAGGSAPASGAISQSMPFQGQ